MGGSVILKILSGPSPGPDKLKTVEAWKQEDFDAEEQKKGVTKSEKRSCQ